MPTASVDLSPLRILLLIAVLVALVPLAWATRSRADQTSVTWFRALCATTLFLTFDLVVFGAFTRLSDSGLGCPDWPGCYGHASPLGAALPIAQAQQALPGGPVTAQKAWIEMAHRYLASGVGALILVLWVASWRIARPNWQQSPKVHLATARWPSKNTEAQQLAPRLPSVVLAGLTFAWVCLQGAFGALTVTMKLFPAIVTLHLLGGMVLLALLTLQVARLTPSFAVTRPTNPCAHLSRHVNWANAVLVAQIALGAWVSTNYAVLACSEFPLCQGQWWPDMNFAQGFQLWRPLGQTADGAPVHFSALTAIHWVHRSVAFVLLAVLGSLAWRMRQVVPLRQHARALAAVLAIQIASGLSNALLGWPLIAALLHTAGAGALVILLTLTWARCRPESVVIPYPLASTSGSPA